MSASTDALRMVISPFGWEGADAAEPVPTVPRLKVHYHVQPGWQGTVCIDMQCAHQHHGSDDDEVEQANKSDVLFDQICFEVPIAASADLPFGQPVLPLRLIHHVQQRTA
jgi:hypothetical protein